MLVVFAFYTTLVAVMNIVAHYDSNLMLPEDIPLLTPESIRHRIFGSKLVLVVEQSMIMTTWGCKICLLLMYNKLTFGLKQQLAVKIIGGYVIFSLVLMEILYFGVWCRPFHNYWAVPVDNVQCSTALHHLILNAVVNISSDLLMMSIPLPLLMTSKLPRTKKLILCGLFGLGLFVILCAVLNKYYSFAHPFSPMWMFWYIREASTAILVANMPICWALMRRLFNLKAFGGQSSKTRTNPRTTPSHQYAARKVYGQEPLGSKSDAGASKGKDGDTSWWDREAMARTESEEFIIMTPSKAKIQPLEIWESKEFDISNDMSSTVDQNNRVIQDVMFDGGPKTRTTVSARRSESVGSRKGVRLGPA